MCNCLIDTKYIAGLVLITNRKSYYELSIGTKLGDLGWPWNGVIALTAK